MTPWIVVGETTISGRVESAAGHPLAAARVSLMAALNRFEQGALLASGKIRTKPLTVAQTDASGRFRLAAPRPGMWTVVVEDEGKIPWEYPLTLLEDTELPTVLLGKAYDLTLRAVDTEGQALVAARGMLSESTRWQRRSTTSGDWWPAAQVARADGEGTLTLTRAIGKKYEALVWAPGHVETLVDMKKHRSPVIQLQAGVPRTLEARQADGRPAANVLVRVGQGRWPAGWTNSDGRLTLAAPREKPLTLELVSEDGRALPVTLLPAAMDSEPVVFSLPPEQRLTGQVVDARQRRPIASALVWMTTDRAVFTHTDSRGTFTLPMTDPAAITRVASEAAGHLRQETATTVLHGAEDLALALEPAAVLRGEVVDDSGEPIADVEIEANVDLERNHLLQHALPVAARTNDQGQFRLARLASEQAYELIFRATGFAPSRFTVMNIDTDVVSSDRRFVLRRGRPASGEVLGPSGMPVAEAQVVLYPSRSSNRGRLLKEDLHTTTSGVDGRFELSQVLPGNYDLGIAAIGLAPVVVPGIEISAAGEPVDLGTVDLGTVVLGAEALISGQVTNPQGEPLDNVKIFYLPRVYPVGSANDLLSIQKLTRSGPGGQFTLGGLQPGQRIDLTFSRNGYRPRELSQVEAASGEILEVVLESALEVSGRVVDENGEAVAEARVSLASRAPGLTSGDGLLGTGARDRGVPTTPAGEFTLSGVLPGQYSLSASAAGYKRSAAKHLDLTADESASELTLVLELGATVGGRVIDHAARPLADIQISVVRPEPAPGVARVRARTQSDGSYQLEGLPVGVASLEVTHPEHPRQVRDLEVRAGFNRLDLSLDSGFEISGRVVDAARSPVAEASVVLTSSSESRKRVRSNADGSFIFRGVGEGRHQIRANKEGYAEARPEASIQVSASPVVGFELILETGGSIEGDILGLEFDQLGAIQVSAMDSRGARVSGNVDHGGGYRIDHLTPGEWTVTATLGGPEQQVSRRVSLEPDTSQVRLDLDFDSGATLSGEVWQEGRPVVGAHVVMSGADLAIPRSSRTGYDGRFLLQGLETGTYRLAVVDFAAGLFHEQEVELDADRDLVVDIDTAELAGRVVDADDGSPLSGALVELEPGTRQGAGGLGWKPAVTADEQGRFTLSHLQSGDWRVKAHKEGFASDQTEVRLSGRKDDLVIALQRTRGLDLEVLLSSGQPAPRVQVTVLDPSGLALASGRYPTGEGGRVRIPGAPAGSWEVLVSAPGEAVAKAAVKIPGPPAKIRLPASGGLAITVPELGETPSPASVTLTGPDGAPYRAPAAGGSFSERWWISRGHLVLDAVPVGQWSVLATATDGRSWNAQAAVRSALVTRVLLE